MLLSIKLKKINHLLEVRLCFVWIDFIYNKIYSLKNERSWKFCAYMDGEQVGKSSTCN
jgi:hypothetical protein